MPSMTEFLNFVLAGAAVLATLTVAALAIVIIAKILGDKIKIDQLLSNGPEASLSRFQFLIFTFVIAFSYIIVMLYKISDSVSAQTITLPDANGALGLLGISAGGYVLSKGIQTSGDTSTTNAKTNADAAASAPPVVATGPVVASGPVVSTGPVAAIDPAAGDAPPAG
jgi:hypothetical protein